MIAAAWAWRISVSQSGDVFLFVGAKIGYNGGGGLAQGVAAKLLTLSQASFLSGE